MKSIKLILITVLLLVTGMAADAALAQGRHGGGARGGGGFPQGGGIPHGVPHAVAPPAMAAPPAATAPRAATAPPAVVRRDGRRRDHIGVFIGAPLFWPWYDPWPYYPYYYSPYAYPPVVAVPSTPPTYIEKGDGQSMEYWYYCTDPEGYYPHVTQCPGGWLRVTAEPPAEQ